jgi:cytochrome c2
MRVSPAVLALALLAIMPAARAADADAGARVFKSQCGTCHAVAPGRTLVGPTLAGLIGRKAGSVPGFRYSPANKQADITWDAPTLTNYLADPGAMIPGTSMIYAGLKNEAQRADLVAYLSTLQ